MLSNVYVHLDNNTPPTKTLKVLRNIFFEWLVVFPQLVACKLVIGVSLAFSLYYCLDLEIFEVLHQCPDITSTVHVSVSPLSMKLHHYSFSPFSKFNIFYR